MLKKIFRSRFVSFFLAAMLLVFAWLVSASEEKEQRTLARQLEKKLHKKEMVLQKELSRLAAFPENRSYDDVFAEFLPLHRKLFRKEGIVFFIYENDTLRYWSEHTVAVETYQDEICLDDRVVQLKNGWYEVFRSTSRPDEKRRIYGLLQVKKEYAYQNNYLVNGFFSGAELGGVVDIVKAQGKDSQEIKDARGEYLFSLKFQNNGNKKGIYTASALLYTLFFLLALWFLKTECNYVSLKLGPVWGVIIMAGTLVTLRFLMIMTGFPEVFHRIPLFNPQHYGDATSYWLPSLGDLLINCLAGLFLAYFFYTSGPYKILTGFTPRKKSILAFSGLLLLAFSGRKINELFAGLIQNSNIPFHINNLFNLNLYSYIAILIIGILLFTFFLMADKFILLTRSLSDKQQITVFAGAGIVHTLISHLLGSLDLVMVLWPFAIVLLIHLIRNSGNYSFAGIVFLVFVFSLYSVHMLLKFSGMKEQDSRRIFAEKLAAEQDPLAEHLFAELAGKITADTSLYSITPIGNNYSGFEKKLSQRYFGGYWSKYEINCYAFDTACFPLEKRLLSEKNDHAYFDNLIKERGRPAENKYLYSIENPSGRISYLANIPLYRKDRTDKRLGNVFIEMNLQLVSEEMGFPELLLDREIGINQELANYSYAKYKKDTLVSYHGKYQYSLTNKFFRNGEGGHRQKAYEGYDHLVYKADDLTLVIISRKSEGLLGKVTTFSYLFTFFSVLLLVLLVLRQRPSGIKISSFNFKNRIQYLLVLMVLISLTLFGAGTIFYIRQQYQAKNKENVNDKVFSALMELRHELSGENVFRTGYREYLTYILKRISAVVFTDVTLYDKEGNIMASSLPKILDEGLISEKMSPEAYYELAINQKLEYTHDERIGELEYLSAYAPVKDNNGKLLAYLNLPYFAKQSELEKEISTFLIALINIYVFLFAISVVVAVFISNYVTKPLKLIQDKLSHITLGKANEPIAWENNDEIGSLVKEYNRMIVELAKSAELLARSERESAWREMAKQVAHEIKNPLTPMKLSVQHLQRTWKDNGPDIGEKIERLTQTLIEQIDTLSHIASEFSAFAKMPKPENEKTDIVPVIENAIDLYRESTRIQMSFTQKCTGKAYVNADKEQLLRVFNNLTRNAIQAIPDESKGRIEISLEQQGENYLVKIKDNGSGIREEMISKIFVPYFTTKTGGVGLGLAMVKSIIENFNGKIWFETSRGAGTTFHISLPAFKEQRL